MCRKTSIECTRRTLYVFCTGIQQMRSWKAPQFNKYTHCVTLSPLKCAVCLVHSMYDFCLRMVYRVYMYTCSTCFLVHVHTVISWARAKTLQPPPPPPPSPTYNTFKQLSALEDYTVITCSTKHVQCTC